MAYISGSKLKGDIYEYRRVKARNITIKRNVQTEQIIEKARDILQKYNSGKLDVHLSDQKIMAQYIDTFGFASRESLLHKLQQESSFNVRKYLSDSKLTWWQKAFRIQPKEADYLSVAQMKKRLAEYKKLGKTLSRGFYHSESQYFKQIRLEEEAVAYAEKFTAGQVQVTQNDAPVLQKYLQVVGNASEQIVSQKALQQLENMSAESFAQPTKRNRLTAWFKNIKQRFMPSSAEVVSLNPAPKPAPRRSFWSKTKVAGIVALFGIAGLLGLKSDKKADARIINKTEQAAQPKKAAVDDKTVVLQPVQKELTAEQKIWQNFYNTKNEILADLFGADTAGLNKAVQEQAKKGIFNIPDNMLSEQIVYTHLIYKAYGLQSPVEYVLNAKQKISAEQQKTLDQAVKTAGQNGLGVKKIAASIAAKSGKKLGRYSAYDHASKKLQTAYITNLKQVRELNHR
ncbi:MAG: hypothetical protein IKR92_03910 [Alphaproteobacteria bacterium]|nr:hypothetical protein [Alphaproteobacteria bacterium]